MRHLSLLLIAVTVLFIVLVIGVFSFMTEELPPQEVIVVPVDPTITYMENALVTQEAAYQSQLDELEQTLQQRQVDFRNKLESLNKQIEAVQEQLNQLQTQEQELLSQLKQLEIRRAQQQSRHQTNLQLAQEQYLSHQAELQAQIEAAQTELDQLYLQLRR